VEANAKLLVIVEDDADVRLLTRALLDKDPGIDVAAGAVSAEDALTLCQTVEPDLIILDHRLSGEMSGLEAAALLKEQAPNSLIVVFSAFDIAEQANANPAVDAFVSKRDLTELLPTVRRLLDL